MHGVRCTLKMLMDQVVSREEVRIVKRIKNLLGEASLENCRLDEEKKVNYRRFTAAANQILGMIEKLSRAHINIT